MAFTMVKRTEWQGLTATSQREFANLTQVRGWLETMTNLYGAPEVLPSPHAGRFRFTVAEDDRFTLEFRGVTADRLYEVDMVVYSPVEDAADADPWLHY